MAASYDIDKGAGKTLQFGNLKGQYMMSFFAIVIGSFLLFAALSIAGAPSLLWRIVIVLGLGGGSSLYVIVSNKKYGQYGLMKQQARNRYPRYLRRERSFFSILTDKEENVQ